jgi:flagellar basal-body rod modification protein FlgD
MTNSVSGTAPSTNTGAETATTSTTKNGVNQQAFLQLLVAQIKNQNPLNPADGVQFLTQLAQFSELEQMVGIRSEIAALRQEFTPKQDETQRAENV